MNQVLWLALLLGACARSAPAPDRAAPKSASAEAPTVAAAPSAMPTPTAQASDPSRSAPPQASSEAPAAALGAGETSDAGAPFGAPPVRDERGELLPQTEDKPRVDSPFFQRAAEQLFLAIVRDEPELALPFFFPVSAYERVKDVQNPARDWELRLVRLFRRDVHEYHRALGRGRAEARFVRLEVPEARAEWMKPGREGNRLGYYRVLRSRLLYTDDRGKERSLEVTSLISWRGEWYLVHLHGFE